MRLAIFAFLLIVFAKTNAAITVQQVDPFVKILPNSNPAAFSVVQSVAHGDKLLIQLLLKTDANDIFTVALSSPDVSSATLAKIKKYEVGYVRVTPTIARPASDQLKSPDQTYPDPLFARDSFSLAKNQLFPILLDVPIDMAMKPGVHTIKVLVRSVSKKEVASSANISFQVFNVTVPAEKMNYITWYHDADYRLMNKGQGVEPFSELYWKIFKNIVRTAKENGQNTFTVNQLFLIKFLKTKDNKWSADFTQFDRGVNIILKEVGMKYVNFRQFAARLGGWDSPFGLTIPKFYGPQYYMNNRALGDSEAMSFYNWFIPAYRQHLKDNNYLSRTLQHIADEPIDANKASYIAIAKYIKGLAPDLTTIEAIQTMDVAPYIDNVVMLLDQMPPVYPAIQQMQQKSHKKFWLYTCNSPQGEYANRFIELPLIKTMLLPWIASRYHLDGYLHWALDFWGDAPYADASLVKFGASQMVFPGGDAWLFYPTYQTVNISIRALALRTGITDVALLDLLRKNRPADAERINNDLVKSFNQYDTNTLDYFDRKKEILTLLSSRK